jgi:hypothetical protein
MGPAARGGWGPAGVDGEGEVRRDGSFNVGRGVMPATVMDSGCQGVRTLDHGGVEPLKH